MLGDSYITATQLGTYLGIKMSVADAIRDAKLAAAVSAASTTIEGHCSRQFNTNGIVEARTFVPDSAHMVIVDDFYDTTTLVIEKRALGATAWSAPWDPASFELEPRNGVVNGQPGWPYRRIILPYWTYLWSIDRVQVQAKWGWPAVPASVTQAAYVIAAQYFKLADAPFGAAGFGSGSDGFAVIKVSDIPQAWTLLKPYTLDSLTVM